uniref:Uncharacterized protein n=1 Tax=Arundo donax TaxID=35708 RepID=A0A0A8Z6I4_ARUDO
MEKRNTPPPETPTGGPSHPFDFSENLELPNFDHTKRIARCLQIR